MRHPRRERRGFGKYNSSIYMTPFLTPSMQKKSINLEKTFLIVVSLYETRSYSAKFFQAFDGKSGKPQIFTD